MFDSWLQLTERMLKRAAPPQQAPTPGLYFAEEDEDGGPKESFAEYMQRQRWPAARRLRLEEALNASMANLRKVYELEYKVAMLSRMREEGPLADRAERALILWRQELDKRVGDEIKTLFYAFVDWLEESKTEYAGANDPTIMRSIQEMTWELGHPPRDTDDRIVLMHRALTTAHHNASMGTFAYGGRKTDRRMEEAIQLALSALSEAPDPSWEREVEQLLSLPKGGAINSGDA